MFSWRNKQNINTFGLKKKKHLIKSYDVEPSFSERVKEMKNGMVEKKAPPQNLLQVMQESSCRKPIMTRPTLWQFQQKAISPSILTKENSEPGSSLFITSIWAVLISHLKWRFYSIPFHRHFKSFLDFPHLKSQTKIRNTILSLYSLVQNFLICFKKYKNDVQNHAVHCRFKQ